MKEEKNNNIKKDVKRNLIKIKDKEKYLNFFQKMEKKLNNSVILIVAILVLAIGIASMFITAYFPSTYNNAIEKTDYKYDNFIINIVFTCIGLAIIYILHKLLEKIKLNYVIAAFSIIFIIISILFCTYIKIGPIADQGFMITGGQAILDRAMSGFIEPGGYLDMFPYQFGFVIYCAVILGILNKIPFITNLFNIDKFIYFQILNCFYSVINILLIYVIAKKIFKNDKKILAILTILLVGFMPYFVLMNTHIYGIIPGLIFALIAVYFTILYLENKKIYNIILAGISISGAIIIKSNYNIVLCAIVIILLMDILKRVELKKIGMLCIIFVIFAFSQFCLDKLIIKIINRDIPTGVPMISYIYMGFAPSNTLSSGWYTADVIEIYNRSNRNTEQAIEETKRLIDIRINHFKGDLKEANRYFWDKIQSTWLNPTFQTIWLATPGNSRCSDPAYDQYIKERPELIEMVNYTSDTYKKEEAYFNIYQIIIFVFAGIALLEIRKEDSIEKLILPVIFIGGLLFHILWETKSIYVIQYYYILLPFTAMGINIFFEKTKTLVNKLKNKYQIIKKTN